MPAVDLSGPFGSSGMPWPDPAIAYLTSASVDRTVVESTAVCLPVGVAT